jgi:uncharacterized protein (TIGR04255 family)
MSTFSPKNADHAISAAAFSINFAGPLHVASIEKAKAIEASVKEFLPGISTFPGLPQPLFAALRLEQAGMPMGIVFQRVQPDGSPAWMLTAQQNFISAQCMDYTRWADVWGKIRIWLRDLYAQVKTPELKVASLSLQYVDQFHADEPIDEDALDKLLKRDTEYLPTRTFRNRD